MSTSDEVRKRCSASERLMKPKGRVELPRMVSPADSVPTSRTTTLYVSRCDVRRMFSLGRLVNSNVYNQKTSLLY
jgi:hypothetical protein